MDFWRVDLIRALREAYVAEGPEGETFVRLRAQFVAYSAHRRLWRWLLRTKWQLFARHVLFEEEGRAFPAAYWDVDTWCVVGMAIGANTELFRHVASRAGAKTLAALDADERTTNQDRLRLVRSMIWSIHFFGADEIAWAWVVLGVRLTLEEDDVVSARALVDSGLAHLPLPPEDRRIDLLTLRIRLALREGDRASALEPLLDLGALLRPYWDAYDASEPLSDIGRFSNEGLRNSLAGCLDHYALAPDPLRMEAARLIVDVPTFAGEMMLAQAHLVMARTHEEKGECLEAIEQLESAATVAALCRDHRLEIRVHLKILKLWFYLADFAAANARAAMLSLHPQACDTIKVIVSLLCPGCLSPPSEQGDLDSLLQRYRFLRYYRIDWTDDPLDEAGLQWLGSVPWFGAASDCEAFVGRCGDLLTTLGRLLRAASSRDRGSYVRARGETMRAFSSLVGDDAGAARSVILKSRLNVDLSLYEVLFRSHEGLTEQSSYAAFGHHVAFFKDHDLWPRSFVAVAWRLRAALDELTGGNELFDQRMISEASIALNKCLWSFEGVLDPPVLDALAKVQAMFSWSWEFETDDLHMQLYMTNLWRNPAMFFARESRRWNARHRELLSNLKMSVEMAVSSAPSAPINPTSIEEYKACRKLILDARQLTILLALNWSTMRARSRLELGLERYGESELTIMFSASGDDLGTLTIWKGEVQPSLKRGGMARLRRIVDSRAGRPWVWSRMVRWEDLIDEADVERLRQAESCTVLPDGALWSIQFGEVRFSDGGRPSTAFCMRPFLSAEPNEGELFFEERLGRFRGPPTKHRVAVIVGVSDFSEQRAANPHDPQPGDDDWLRAEQDLPLAGREAQMIAALYEGARRPMSRAAFAQAMADAGIVHLASHTQVCGSTPMRSRLYVGGAADDYLTAREISEMSISGIVVLSSCSTAAGQEAGSEDFLGVAYAFLWAGAEAVVAALWEVEDAVGMEFSERFHRSLIEGATVAEATKESTRRISEGVADPKLYSPFVVVGNGSARLAA